MAKINYTKAEEAFDDELGKITVDKLLTMADEASARTSSNTDPTTSDEPEKNIEMVETQLLAAVHIELKLLNQQGQDPYKKWGIKRNEIKKFVENPNALRPQDWVKIKKLKEKIDEFKAELAKLPHLTDAELVEEERRKSINQRFNVNEKWLPLQ